MMAGSCSKDVDEASSKKGECGFFSIFNLDHGRDSQEVPVFHHKDPSMCSSVRSGAGHQATKQPAQRGRRINEKGRGSRSG